ncbi:unnamed protein product [Sympodiomycopsis kandeliae]
MSGAHNHSDLNQGSTTYTPQYAARAGHGSAADYYNSSHHDQQQTHWKSHSYQHESYADGGKHTSHQQGEQSASRGLKLRPLIKPRRILGSGLVPSFSSGLFLAVVIVEALAVLGLVISVFAIVQLRTEVLTQDAKTVPVFLALFVFGMVYLVLVALDAFRLHNTIQIIGVLVFNLALLITAALQVSQVRAAFDNQDRYGRGVPCQDRPGRRCGAVSTLYPAVKPQLIATPIIIAVAEAAIIYLTFRLWQDFGWQIYRKIGADLIKRKMMLVYQVFVVFLKFDFFFGTAFCLAYLILVSQHHDAEFGLTIAALPAAIIVLILSAVAVRKEVYTLMIFCILCMIAGIVYFVFKITRIFEPGTEEEYRTVRLSMTFFSVFSIASLLATVILAIWCTFNFGKGLRDAHESLGTLFSASRFGFGSQNKDTYGDALDGGLNAEGGGQRLTLTDSRPEQVEREGEGQRLEFDAITPSSEDDTNQYQMRQQQHQYVARQPSYLSSTASQYQPYHSSIAQPYSSYPVEQSTSPMSSSSPNRLPPGSPNSRLYPPTSTTSPPPIRPNSKDGTGRGGNYGLSRKISLD